MASKARIGGERSMKLDPEDFPHLTKSEFDQVRELFRRYDATNSGSIRKHDLIDLLKGKQWFDVLLLILNRDGQLYAW